MAMEFDKVVSAFSSEPAKLLIFDGNAALHRVLHIPALLGMRVEDVPTGGINGMMKVIRKELSLFDPHHAIFVWDSSSLSKRRLSLYPDYKATRPGRSEPKTLEEAEKRAEYSALFSCQKSRIDCMLNDLGIYSVSLDGYEADDIIAFLAREFSASMQVCIVSDDFDMCMLIDKNISVHRPINEELISIDNAKEKLTVTPEMYMFIKVLCGDKSDNLDGVPKVGPSTAEYIVSKMTAPTIENLVSTCNDIISSSVEATSQVKKRVHSVLGNLDIVKRNVDMIDLSKEYFSEADINKIGSILSFPVKANERNIEMIFNKYQFNALTQFFRNWFTPFLRLKPLEVGLMHGRTFIR